MGTMHLSGHRRGKSCIANLASGEQQRVAIASTLATGAPVLLADEPAGNLDKAKSDQVIKTLGQLWFSEVETELRFTREKVVSQMLKVCPYSRDADKTFAFIFGNFF